MEWKTKFVKRVTTKSTKNLPELTTANFDHSRYVTARQLAEEYRLNKELIMSMLARRDIMPVAKLFSTDESGKTLPGRPQMCFDITEANIAIDIEIENIYK